MDAILVLIHYWMKLVTLLAFIKTAYTFNSTYLTEQLTLCQDLVNQSEAAGICSSLSPHHTLWTPLSQDELDSIFSKLLYDYGVTAVWMSVQRHNMSGYVWLDNEQHNMSSMMPKPSPHQAMECGRVKLGDREISNMWCGKRNFGYICQINGSYPPGYFTYNCMYNKAKNVSFFYGCGMANWYAAEYMCRQRGALLAVIEGQQLLEQLINYMTQQQGQSTVCDIYWVGFTRTVWTLPNITDTEDETLLNGLKKAVPLWQPGQPHAYNKTVQEMNSCAVLTNNTGLYGWRAENCSYLHPFICQIMVKNTPAVIPAKEFPKQCHYAGITATLVISVILNAVLIIYVVIRHIRQHKSKRSESPNETIAEKSRLSEGDA